MAVSVVRRPQYDHIAYFRPANKVLRVLEQLRRDAEQAKRQ